MIRTQRVGWLIAAGLVLVASFIVAAGAQAQSVITGKVTDAQGNPIPGANVVVPQLGLGIGANTKVDGTYSITVPSNSVGKSVVITARRIGFTPISRTVAIASGSQAEDFRLSQDARRLDDVVVTGVAEATSSKNLTISVGKIDEAQLKEVPAISPATALAGKVSGVRVSFTQGQPGSDPAIRVRTSTTLGVGAGGVPNRNQGPLVLVDGVITKNGLADIDGNDIENIEVLKGAASANTYGSDAAGGVVSITTKRGKNSAEGKVNFLTRNEFGTSSVEHLVPLLQHNPYELNADGSFKVTASGNRVIKTDHYIDNPFPAGTYRNQLTENLQNGRNVTNYAQISLRKGTSNFSTSFPIRYGPGLIGSSANGFERSIKP